MMNLNSCPKCGFPNCRCGPLKDGDEMPFGKYGGEKLGDVPASYLLWCYEQEWIHDWPGVRDYIKDGINWLKDEAKRERR